jgi:ferric-dicitrate binding protein FerR (iron transport regulator)
MMNQFEPLSSKAALIVKSLQNDLTVQERLSLNEWLAESEANQALYNELTNEATLASELAILAKFDAQADWQKIAEQTIGKQTKTAPVFSINYRKWLSAAAILLIACLGVFQFWLNRNNSHPIAKNSKHPIIDIAPGGNKATLKLADGTIVTLNDSVNGFQATQQNVKLVIKNGEITYQSLGQNNEIIYNTITTPRGGQYKLLLDDGTKVWLNAASSIKYPTTFSGDERIVELTGEGYFEVAHDASKPFKVLLPGIGRVDAIGTAFNINAYSDERLTKTTLVEGKVKVAFGNKTDFLIPGQQAQLTPSGKLLVLNQVDVDEVVAWKNGQFNFKQMNVENIMRQIGRWYEIEVIYNGPVSQETFSGIVSRNSHLMEVLKIMEEGGVRFKIEGKKINVY